MALVVVLACCAGGIGACGGNGQVSVSLDSTQGGGTVSYKPGQVAHFVVTLVNNGPGDAPGITVAVAMPPTFHYKSTDSIDDRGSARTQPLDARVGTSDPEWGFWDIAAPGSTSNATVIIAFSVQIEGTPNTYALAARAQGDNTAGPITSRQLPVQVVPAPSLSLTARVDRTSLYAGIATNYRITVTNTGTQAAGDVALLVTLPPVMAFQSSVAPFAGNASQGSGSTPVAGSVEVFYSGFTIPAASSDGPGFIVVVFRAQVVNRPESGRFTVDAQVTDDAGDIIELNNAAPVTIQAGINQTPITPPPFSVTPTPD